MRLDHMVVLFVTDALIEAKDSFVSFEILHGNVYGGVLKTGERQIVWNPMTRVQGLQTKQML